MPAVRASQRPLGLKADFRVSSSVLETLRFIETFDPEAVERKTRSARLPSRGAMLEFKRFLALPLLLPRPAQIPVRPELASRRTVACVRTEHTAIPRVLRTRLRAGLLDHVRGKSRKETEKRIMRGPMQFTVESISKTFDKVNTHYWNKSAICGPCSPKK